MSISDTIRLVMRYAWIPILTWGASVFVAEGAFRLAGTRVAATMEGFYESFGDGGFRHKGGADAYMNWYSGPFTVYTDNLGLRVDQKHQGDPTPPDVDILIIGDSQAFGQGLDDEHTVMGVFREEAAKHGVTVANASVAGHFIKNQIELVRWLVQEKGLRPKVAVICPTPHMTGYFDQYVKAYVHNGTLFGGPPGRKELMKKWLSGHSAVYITLRDAFRTNEADSTEGGMVFGYYTGADSLPSRVQWLTEELNNLKAVLAPIGCDVKLCYLPLAVEVDIEELAKKAGRANVQSGVPLQILQQSAARTGISPVIDLRPALAAARQAGETLELEGDPHYSQPTSRRVGELMWNSFDWKEALGTTPAR